MASFRSEPLIDIDGYTVPSRMRMKLPSAPSTGRQTEQGSDSDYESVWNFSKLSPLEAVKNQRHDDDLLGHAGLGEEAEPIFANPLEIGLRKPYDPSPPAVPPRRKAATSYKKSTTFASITTTASQDKQLMGHDWYHGSITREQATDVVKTMQPGEFIVRDSQTVHGGYVVSLRVSEDMIRKGRKLSRDVHITDEMCVTHFLIQHTADGRIKLQGWNECSFPTLPDFIARHCVDKLCLPCVLKLPGGSSGRGKWSMPPFSGGENDRADIEMDQTLVSEAGDTIVLQLELSTLNTFGTHK